MIDNRPTGKLRLLALTSMLTFTITAPLSAEVYKTVDENGKVSFGDKALPQAQKVELKATNSADSVDLPSREIPTEAPAEDVSIEYSSIKITRPDNDSVIANGLVPLTVIARLTPTLQREHQLTLSIDGKVYMQGHQTSFKIKMLDRGERKLQLSVSDKDGKLLKRSDTIRLFVHRPSTTNNARPTPAR